MKVFLFRMWQWWLITAVLIGLVAYFAPPQIPVLINKAALVTGSACLTYVIDRSLFARVIDRLDESMPRDILASSRVIARAFIFVGTVLGFSLGV
jgi:hypothetical protein